MSSSVSRKYDTIPSMYFSVDPDVNCSASMSFGYNVGSSNVPCGTSTLT